jgi:hypothetical protein
VGDEMHAAPGARNQKLPDAAHSERSEQEIKMM